ncbi:MAG: DUF1996 domain-containing protein [Acidimicrobiales bacterium]
MSLAVAALLAGCGGDGPGAASSEGRTDGATPIAAVRTSPTEAGPQGRVPQFVVECEFSHAGPGDPIVHYGHPGRSHLHTFFGATVTNAHTTADDLATSDTTCNQKLDRAAYWAPALLDHGEMVEPSSASAYYRPGVGVDPTTVEPYPFGLEMLGGDQTATAPQPLDVVAWSCGTGSARAAEPPTCPEGRPLRLLVAFPDCWDGEHLDSDDHVSHTARSADGRCPESHPVPVPQLLLAISYPVIGTGHDLALASGSVLTGHADFFNGWDEDKLRTEVASCIHRGVTCGVVSNRPKSVSG